MTESRVRLSIVGVVVLALFSALFARLWYLQVAAGQEFQAQATSNSVRIVQEPPIRGRILDAKGRVLADNRVANVITIDRTLDAEQRKQVTARLATLLSVPVEQLRARLDDPRVSPYAPVPVAVDVPYAALAYVSEHQPDFPGVKAEPEAFRRYPNASLAAHVLGYVGEINEQELAAQPKAGRYKLGDEIGKAGVEQTFESDLRGKPGLQKLEIDSSGQVLRTLGTKKPEPGHDVQLTVDLDVQRVAEQALAEGLASARTTRDVVNRKQFKTLNAPAGAVVVLDAKDGSVVAMASNPTFDPNEFVDGIPTQRWKELNDPANHYPLLDRAISGQYAPGSTFKLISAQAGLVGGQITANSTINDTGKYKISDQTFTNSNSTPYGRVALARALTVSSDVYFYTIGGNLWSLQRRQQPGGDVIQDTARAYGFGRPSGIALPNEASGRVPDAAWKQRIHDARPDAFPYPDWLPGDNVQLAVGQGDMLATPLQLALAYQGFAANGSLGTPRLVQRVLDSSGKVVRDLPPVEAGKVPVAARDTIVAGLDGVVNDPKGTAHGAFGSFPVKPVPVAGKTGTAQVANKQNTSLFIAFGPVADPRYVVAVVIEEGGYGAETAAPIARAVFEGLNGLPVQPVSTIPPSEGN